MKPMRRSDRKVTDPAEILAILSREKVCRLAMVDQEGAYIVPLSYAYALTDAHVTEGLPQGLTLYFHSASKGRKIDVLRANPHVCFEIDGAHAFAGGAELTDYTYHYESIIGNGDVTFLTDADARMDAMIAIAQHQSGEEAEKLRAMPRDDRWMQTDALAVFALTVTGLQAKRHD